MKNIFICLAALLMACNNGNNETPKTTEVKKDDSNKPEVVERLDSSINDIISKNAEPEIIASGLDWSEGPVWVESNKMLLFSDVPRDTVYKWTAEKGKEKYLTPSGYTGTTPRGG